MSHPELVAWRPETRRAANYFLVPERLIFGDGAAPGVPLGSHRGKLLVVTLEINRVTEQDGLLVSVWGSVDKMDWGTTPLLTFPKKSYCGIYSALLNLANKSEIEYLRVHWNVRRSVKGDSAPAFGFLVFAEESGSRMNETRHASPRLEVVRGS